MLWHGIDTPILARAEGRNDSPELLAVYYGLLMAQVVHVPDMRW